MDINLAHTIAGAFTWPQDADEAPQTMRWTEDSFSFARAAGLGGLQQKTESES